MREAPVAIGQLLAGKYRVEKVLGAGAMGVVVAANQIALNRRVALKFLFAQKGEVSREAQARFLREARVAAMLQSQHAAKVLDVGTLEDGAPYIVMEFLEGKDLAALLEERGPLPVEEAVTYILQVCEAVDEAHAAGIVHRDIKPANLFLAKGLNGSFCAKLVDFGVAKLGGGPLDLTGTTQVLGSPLYMSPEAMSGPKDIDARTDIWALGVSLYQLLAGVTPFERETIEALMAAVYLKPPEPIETYRADLPPGLAAVILRTLEKERSRRFATVAEFAAALAPYASGGPAPYLVPAPPMALQAPPAKEDTRAAAAAAITATPAVRGATPLTAAFMLALAAALPLAWFFLFRSGQRSPVEHEVTQVTPVNTATVQATQTPVASATPPATAPTVTVATAAAPSATASVPTPHVKPPAATSPRMPSGPAATAWDGSRH